MNKYILTEDEVTEVFEQSIEVDIVRNRCKVYGLNIPRPVVLIENINTQQMNTMWSTRWLIGSEYLKSAIFTNNCNIVVDRSFFPEHPEFIAAYWFFFVRM